MHEYSIALTITQTALDTAAGRKISKVSVSIGALSAVFEDSLRMYLEMLLEEQGSPGVSVVATHVAAKCRCHCGNVYEIVKFGETCSLCDSFTREIIDGKECFVESIEVEE